MDICEFSSEFRQEVAKADVRRAWQITQADEAYRVGMEENGEVHMLSEMRSSLQPSPFSRK